MPMPFDPPCFRPEFFFDDDVLSVVRGVMVDDRIVADQWHCDVPLHGSVHQGVHVDYKRPLFAEAPDLELPSYMLVVSFGLVQIAMENGPIEIAPGTHRLPRTEAVRAVEASEIGLRPVPLEVGDVMIRHPWALHRGSPNTTDTPRALVSIRYVRRWYADESREVSMLPRAVWETLPPEQQDMMRFPRGDQGFLLIAQFGESRPPRCCSPPGGARTRSEPTEPAPCSESRPHLDAQSWRPAE